MTDPDPSGCRRLVATAVLALVLAAGARRAGAEDEPAAPAPAPRERAGTSVPVASAPETANREDERDLRLARAARAGVARIQWRGTGPDGPAHERNAIIVDSLGLLLMAGAPSPPRGTLTASFTDGRVAKATVVATDLESALTLLWVPVTGLPASPLRLTGPAAEPDPSTGPRTSAAAVGRTPPVGTRVLMVTGSGAMARGTLRGGDRTRDLPTGRGDETTRLTCLDEAAMATVAEDLGSPWIDEEGRVVGLLVGATGAAAPQVDPPGTLRVEPTAAYAIPARVAAIVWPLLRADRYVARSRLGVASKALDEAVESHVCRDCGGGLVIVGVQPGGPAEHAAVARHDILVGVGGLRLRRGMSLADALLPHRPGSQVALDLVRRGEPLRVDVTLGARADD